MRRLNFSTACAVAALMLAAGPVLAQEPLRPGQTVQGAVTGDEPADDYRITARAGQRFEIVMRSEAFDAYLEVFAPGAPDTALASDDDGLGEGTHARLRFTAPEAGTYVLRARPLTEGEGDYSLVLTERPPAPPAPRPQAIRMGGEVRGELTDSDPEQDAGPRYDAYMFRGRSGDRVAIDLESDDFDPLVRLGRMSRAGVFEELASNDDAPGGGLNARLVHTLPASGDYVIRATGYAADAAGTYVLKLAEGPAPAPLDAIAIGDTVQGELTAEDGMNDGGQRADFYRFRAREGQRVTATLSSSAFDAYLVLHRETANGREEVARDDDGAGSGTDARLTTTLTAGGTYVIEARAFGSGLGAYSLSLAEAVPPPPAAQLAFDETVQGEITDQDATDDNSRRYDAYVFRGQAGRRVQVIVRSGDFDSFVEIGRPGDAWQVLASDDDGLGEGLDSRLNFTLPEDGDYELRAMPLGGDARGLYSIQLIDRGPEPLPGSILAGVTTRGSLAEADAIDDAGVSFDAYEIAVKSGDRLRLEMVSNAFDAFVEIGRLDADGGFESLASDDDGLSDTHAQLDWTAPDDGVYVIRARSYAPGGVGDYALTVDKQP